MSIVLEAAESEGFEVRDVESLREHYARTPRHWVSNIEAAHDAVVAETDEVTYRIWRLYMAGSAHGFHAGGLKSSSHCCTARAAGRHTCRRHARAGTCLPQTAEDRRETLRVPRRFGYVGACHSRAVCAENALKRHAIY